MHVGPPEFVFVAIVPARGVPLFNAPYFNDISVANSSGCVPYLRTEDLLVLTSGPSMARRAVVAKGILLILSLRTSQVAMIMAISPKKIGAIAVFAIKIRTFDDFHSTIPNK
jgi:hypothetical protein